MGKRGPKPKVFKSLEPIVEKQKPWSKRKKRRGRWANKDRQKEEYGEGEDLPYMQLRKHSSMDPMDDGDEDRQALSDNEIEKSLEKSDSSKQDVPSSNVSEDSRSSFNDRKSKDSRNSPSSSSGDKVQNEKRNQNKISIKIKSTKRDYDTSIESDASEDVYYGRPQKKQRRPRVRTLDSNPLYWTIDDVFRYLRKTGDCKELANRIRKEVLIILNY